VKKLKAEIADLEKPVLNGLDLEVGSGEVHAIMGQNGSGKSTFSKVLVGHPDYTVVDGSVQYKGEDLLDLEPEERSHAGVFLSFQNPVSVPGVNNTDFLRLACNSRRKAKGEPELDPIEFYGYLTPILEDLKIDNKFLNRNVNEGFSGGERKRNEILQLAVLDPDLCILDEIDSGLDIDALREVAEAVNLLRKRKPKLSVILITHYQRLLDYIEPDFVHIMKDGEVITTGDKQLAKQLEEGGYKGL
jgi:Fe-S cluster assembly ATP-binding protein